MSTTITINPKAEIVYPTSDDAIKALKSQYLPLVVKGEDDKAGFEACDKARKHVKTLRCEVESRRKELKADALEYGRRVDSEAKRLTDLLTPIENHLEHQVAIVAEAKKRREEAERKAKEDRFHARLTALSAVRAMIVPKQLMDMPEAEYQELLAKATAEYQAAEAKAKQEREEAERRAEAERQQRLALEAERERERKALEAEREQSRKVQAELDRVKAEQLAAERKKREEAEAEARRIQAEKDAAERKAEAAAAIAKAEKAAAERRLREAEEKAEREKREAEAAARLAESRRIEAEREAKLKAEREAAEKIADEAEFEEIKFCFPTIEDAWVEIHRLRKIEREYNRML